MYHRREQLVIALAVVYERKIGYKWKESLPVLARQMRKDTE